MTCTLANHRGFPKGPAPATQPDIFREMHRYGVAWSQTGLARRKGQLAQIMHKNLPRRALKCVVSAHPARCRALPARSEEHGARSRLAARTCVRELTCVGNVRKNHAA